MRTQSETLAAIQEQGILPMFSSSNPAVCVNVLKALHHSGMKVVEFTNRCPEALQNFQQVKAARDSNMQDMLLGVGTIKTVDDLRKYIDAGADFIVCPGMIPEVGKMAVDAGLLWIPGCMTVTEIMIAEQTGSQLIKLFPGSILTPAYISAVKEIFPGLYFMPTGGVELDRDNISAWFKAGACAVGMGSKLVSKPLMESEHYDTIEERAKQVLAIIANYRKPEAAKESV